MWVYPRWFKVFKTGNFSLVFFLWALLWVLWSPALSYGEEPIPAEQSYENELLRLTEISMQLGRLNELLRNELENSRKNSSDLENRLKASKTELEQLQAELKTLQSSLIELRLNATTSLQESKQLKDSLQKTEDSLQNLEQSFNDYKTAAEQELKRLEQSRNRYQLFLLIAGTLAVSGWTAFGLSLIW
jgi:chromosome segregation ATPase